MIRIFLPFLCVVYLTVPGAEAEDGTFSLFCKYKGELGHNKNSISGDVYYTIYLDENLIFDWDVEDYYWLKVEAQSLSFYPRTHIGNVKIRDTLYTFDRVTGEYSTYAIPLHSKRSEYNQPMWEKGTCHKLDNVKVPPDRQAIRNKKF